MADHGRIVHFCCPDCGYQTMAVRKDVEVNSKLCPRFSCRNRGRPLQPIWYETDADDMDKDGD